MKSFLFRLFHRPSFQHTYSTCKLYYCKKVFEPVRIGRDVYFPIRWFKVSVYEILQDPTQLKYIREALFNK